MIRPEPILALTVFLVVNQAYFMGIFSLIAGCSTPPAYDAKGTRRFVRDRLRRLGLALVVFGFVLDPATAALGKAHDAAGFFQNWFRMMSNGWSPSGPLWFAEALMIFTFGFLTWRRFTVPSPRSMPGHRDLLLTAVAVGATAFALRLVWPVGQTISNLQPAYFASYVVLFAAGAAGASGEWLTRIDRWLWRPWGMVSAVVFAILLLSVAADGDYAGGWSLRTAVYAFFEPFCALGVILGLLRLFRTRVNVGQPWLRFLADRAYVVYIVYPLVLVAATRALGAWRAAPLVKFAVVGSIACVGCVMLGSLVLMIPGARREL